MKAELTSAQGRLSSLSHHVSLIQNDELEPTAGWMMVDGG
jgi:hypothetical protein